MSTINRDPLQDLLGYQLRRASAVVMADLGDALTAIDLRPTEATMLMLIQANPGCSQSDIGRVLGIKRPNMVPLIAGLVKAGLVERSANDGRSNGLHLTDSGIATFDRIRNIVRHHEARVEAMVGPSARESVMSALRDIRQA